ncbi:MAG: RdgB/HAM1 family non-canonical purine NTP pyrophosphatase [Sedimentisphaerales bacterium]|nr:RdgB/HAM1 family non-canonical purine NTP pyrophosphatase [Sedimentisphaerales bacterium]
MKQRILVATTNQGKLRELSSMLAIDIDWLSLADFPAVEEVVEDGATFAENARKKALGYAVQTGLWTLADDSGLVIDALDGAPGIHSARFCGAAASGKDRKTIDRLNCEKVLDLMKNVPDERRSARFVCRLCLADPDRVLLETEGLFEGQITRRPQGENGFGYDPIFFVPGCNKTVAQLTHDEKNAISHRGSAIRLLRPKLIELLRA